MGMPNAPQSYKTGGSDGENRCQMDILTCRRDPKTLHASAGKIDKACASHTDSRWDWNPGAQSGHNSGTRERLVDRHLGPKDEVSRVVKVDFGLLSAELQARCVGDGNLFTLNSWPLWFLTRNPLPTHSPVTKSLCNRAKHYCD